jgi:hypothetical protein
LVHGDVVVVVVVAAALANEEYKSSSRSINRYFCGGCLPGWLLAAVVVVDLRIVAVVCFSLAVLPFWDFAARGTYLHPQDAVPPPPAYIPHCREKTIK